MGLDVSHGCYSGNYRWFSLWRNELAKLAGYKITQMPDRPYIDIPDLDYDSFAEKSYYGKWEKTPDDILIVLLVHSDTDGYIYPEHTEPLAKRLRELVKIRHLDDVVDNAEMRNRIFITTHRFIEGLEEAAKNKEKVCFS